MVPNEQGKGIQPDEGQNKPNYPQDENSRLNVNVYKKDPDKPSKAEKYLIGISIFLLLFNIVTTKTACEQADAAKIQAEAALIQANTSKQAIDLAIENAKTSDDVSKKSLDIASRSADASISSARISEKNRVMNERYMRIQTRPYPVIKGYEPFEFIADKEIKIMQTIQNYGATPAYNLSTSINMFLCPKDSIKSIKNLPFVFTNFQKMILPPSELAHTQKSITFNQQEIKEINDAIRFWVIRCLISYNTDWEEDGKIIKDYVLVYNPGRKEFIYEIE